MRRTRVVVAAGAVFGALVLTGCGGGSGSDASTSAHGIASGEPTAAKTSASSAPSSSSTTTPSSSGTAAGAPGVPQAARQHTKAGAQAFVTYYLTTMNQAAQHPVPEPIKEISRPGCKTCAEWSEVFSTLVKDSTHYDGVVFGIPTNVRVTEISPESCHLFFNLHQNAANIRSQKTGAITSPGKETRMNVVFELKWTSAGWRTAEVQKNA